MTLTCFVIHLDFFFLMQSFFVFLWPLVSGVMLLPTGQEYLGLIHCSAVGLLSRGEFLHYVCGLGKLCALMRFKTGNSCYYSVQTRLHPKNLKIKIYKTIILPVRLYGCEVWSLTSKEECRLRVFENRFLR